MQSPSRRPHPFFSSLQDPDDASHDPRRRAGGAGRRVLRPSGRSSVRALRGLLRARRHVPHAAQRQPSLRPRRAPVPRQRPGHHAGCLGIDGRRARAGRGRERDPRRRTLHRLSSHAPQRDVRLRIARRRTHLPGSGARRMAAARGSGHLRGFRGPTLRRDPRAADPAQLFRQALGTSDGSALSRTSRPGGSRG